jgi:opacity protein-like surface antigen
MGEVEDDPGAVVGVSCASAADLPAQVYAKAPVMVDPAYNWSGFYIGGHVGGIWGRSRVFDDGVLTESGARLQAGTGLVSSEVLRLALFALPGTLVGAWLGARTYRGLSDRNFRDIVLALLFLSGLGLVWSSV